MIKDCSFTLQDVLHTYVYSKYNNNHYYKILTNDETRSLHEFLNLYFNRDNTLNSQNCFF
jgi:hypothetical protein